MVPGFDLKEINMLGKLISEFERFHLEGAAPTPFDPRDLCDTDEQTFFRIRTLSNFWTYQGNADFCQRMIDLAISAHDQDTLSLTLLLLGSPRELAVYISLGAEHTTRTLLEGIFPGIVLQPYSTRKLADVLPTHCIVQGVMTGVPSRKDYQPERHEEPKHQTSDVSTASSTDQFSQSLLERVIRGMYGATWAYVVTAYPQQRIQAIQERMKVVDLLTHIVSRSRVQWQSTKQDSLQVTSVESGSETHAYSGDMVNYRAQYLIKLLERELERLDQATAVGRWTVRTYFGASQAHEARRLSSLLLGTMAGPSSRPVPLRTALCKPSGAPLEQFSTPLSSKELATLIQFPREEVPGYSISDYVRFDVDFASDENSMPIGCILQNGQDTNNTFDISLDALTKHVVVVGVTGSGKTTTIMNLLDRVVEAQRQFLVIEPAKTEYRTLRTALESRTDVRVYTLGNEMVAPFRLNPFEFETRDEIAYAPLATHIDFLKAVFNAAFVLYSPMPHVLEEALHEVYEDKGWDLASGTNNRIKHWSERHRYPIFPTLTELYYKVEAVTNRLGYDREVESNVKAGLKARIGSLRIGSKGLMLDTPYSIPMHDLLSTPTILELENIGSDDEKTFLMGLFLSRLYEYRRMQAALGEMPGSLQHLLVFEEAHRLLKNTTTQVDTESSNMRAQAIEVFTNMLSEVRAYGEGVLVAEQIPSKLAPDVLKNTNLKIVHRLIAQDDRLSLGQTMNMNEEQQANLGLLEPGMAVVYAEGADHSYLIRVENYKRRLKPLIDLQLKVQSRNYVKSRSLLELPSMERFPLPRSTNGDFDPALFQAAGKLLSAEKYRHLWARLLLCIVLRPVHILEILTLYTEYIEEEMSHLGAEQQHMLLLLLMIRGSAEALQERGARFGWTYEQVEELRLQLTEGLLLLAPTEEADDTDELLTSMNQSAENLTSFVNTYIELLTRKQGPFPGCTFCPSKCFYRAEVSILLKVKNQRWVLDELTSTTHASKEERYEATAQALVHIAQSWLGDDIHGSAQFGVESVGYCAGLHTAAWAEYSEWEQLEIGQQLAQQLFLSNGQQD